MKHFTDRVAAITGAGSGMGRSLAVALAREGCHLALADRNAVSLAETAQLVSAAAPPIVAAPGGSGVPHRSSRWRSWKRTLAARWRLP
jgi:NAD(P)-dependent dehydrogenase (short-subunit alcohol dehydrogenase family)